MLTTAHRRAHSDAYVQCTLTGLFALAACAWETLCFRVKAAILPWVNIQLCVAYRGVNLEIGVQVILALLVAVVPVFVHCIVHVDGHGVLFLLILELWLATHEGTCAH